MAPMMTPRGRGPALAPPQEAEVVAEALRKVQAWAMPRRTRTKDHFADFDRLHCGRITKAQFQRGLRGLGVKLDAEEVDALAERYTTAARDGDGAGSLAQGLQVIRYDRFCEEVDTVFSTGKSLQSDALIDRTVQRLLCRLAAHFARSGTSLEGCFFPAAPLASPRTPRSARRAPPAPLKKVSAGQFRREFQAIQEITGEDVNMLLSRYGTADSLVDLDRMQGDMDKVPGCTAPQSGYSENTSWSQQRLGPVEKIRSKVAERRVLLSKFFQDFDALRRGVCTVGQLKTVFAITMLDRDVDRGDFEKLVSLYSRDDRMFCYVDFCTDVECVFTMPGLEKDPTMSCRMPDSETTAPGRRNRQHVSAAVIQKVAEIEDRLRQKIQYRGIDMRPAFSDLDKTHSGHVSRSKMERVLSFFGIELDVQSIDILCSVYCDLGNHVDFNYLDFCESCELTEESAQIAADQKRNYNRELTPPKYFDSRGYIRPKDISGSTSTLSMRCGTVS